MSVSLVFKPCVLALLARIQQSTRSSKSTTTPLAEKKKRKQVMDDGKKKGRILQKMKFLEKENEGSECRFWFLLSRAFPPGIGL